MKKKICNFLALLFLASFGLNAKNEKRLIGFSGKTFVKGPKFSFLRSEFIFLDAQSVKKKSDIDIIFKDILKLDEKSCKGDAFETIESISEVGESDYPKVRCKNFDINLKEQDFIEQINNLKSFSKEDFDTFFEEKINDPNSFLYFTGYKREWVDKIVHQIDPKSSKGFNKISHKEFFKKDILHTTTQNNSKNPKRLNVPLFRLILFGSLVAILPLGSIIIISQKGQKEKKIIQNNEQ